jgi:hypothetical protein
MFKASEAAAWAIEDMFGRNQSLEELANKHQINTTNEVQQFVEAERIAHIIQYHDMQADVLANVAAARIKAGQPKRADDVFAAAERAAFQ